MTDWPAPPTKTMTMATAAAARHKGVEDVFLRHRGLRQEIALNELFDILVVHKDALTKNLNVMTMRLQLCFQGLSCSVERHFHIGFGNVHHFGHLCVGVPINVAELQGGALLLGQPVEELVHQRQALFALHLLVRQRCVIRGFYGFVVERKMLSILLLRPIESQIAADGEAVGFEIVDFTQGGSSLPCSDKGILHNVFRFKAVKRDA